MSRENDEGMWIMRLFNFGRWRYATVLVVLVGALVVWAETRVNHAPALARQEGSPQPDVCAVLPAPATEPPHSHNEVGAVDQASPVVEHVHEETLGSPAPGGKVLVQPAAFDLVFIDAMILHQEGAAAMARLATARAEHPELITLSRSIVAEQQAAVDQLRAWRDRWYPGAPPAPAVQTTILMDEAAMLSGSPADGGLGMGPTVMDPAAELRQLCAAALPLDLTFIDLMTLHQRTTIAMAELALQRAQHAELTTFAQAVTDSAQREIDQLAAWRVVWSGTGATPSPVSARDAGVDVAVRAGDNPAPSIDDDAGEH